MNFQLHKLLVTNFQFFFRWFPFLDFLNFIITDNVIVDTMIGYLAESIFLQMVMDSDKAWNKADTPAQAIRAETELRELIKVVVDKHMAPKLAGNVRNVSRQQMAQIERQAIIDSWKEWEAYQ